ncbi:MAG: hypothetical protein M1273_08345 [Deltaproteobacteria bacterium]|jgi:hypothetical protein|nr:hypothetical protein [Deltaproteobacteria bacterium]
MSIIKNGKYYYYDFVFEGKRYRHSCKTTDKNIVKQVEIYVKNDVIKKTHGLPTENKYLLFRTAWENYLKNIGNTQKNNLFQKLLL